MLKGLEERPIVKAIDWGSSDHGLRRISTFSTESHQLSVASSVEFTRRGSIDRKNQENV